MSDPRCFKVQVVDNVATMLDDVAAGVRVHVLGDSDRIVESLEPISMKTQPPEIHG